MADGESLIDGEGPGVGMVFEKLKREKINVNKAITACFITS